jgi:hypothetical protein
MSTQNEAGQSPGPTPTLTDKVTFQDVVAYLHGVTDAVQAMQTSCLSVRPAVFGASTAPLTSADVALLTPDPNPSARLTLRLGEAAIELEGRLVVTKTPLPFAPRPTLPNRSGARLVDFDDTGADEASEVALAVARGTLPYWAPAVSIVPLRPFAGSTERPLDLDEQKRAEMQHTAYSALALSLVPIAPVIPSAWPVEGEEGERVSGIRLRAAPLSAELYALTGTNDYSG